MLDLRTVALLCVAALFAGQANADLPVLVPAAPTPIDPARAAEALARAEAFWNPPARPITPFLFSEVSSEDGAPSGPVRRTTPCVSLNCVVMRGLSYGGCNFFVSVLLRFGRPFFFVYYY